MRFIDRSDLRKRFEGKTVAIVGSGPGILDNPAGLIDSHEVVVRVNNYKLVQHQTGRRTDVFFSFFGASIAKTREDLQRDGVTLCMCKCPDAQFMESAWHRRTGKMEGVDFRGIYRRRQDWWFCDTFIPTAPEFYAQFDLLGKHVPTTGFSAILEVLSLAPKGVYLTGFDFFRSRKHNVNEPWRQKNLDDPIGHVPETELAWLRSNLNRYPIAVDPRLASALRK